MGVITERDTESLEHSKYWAFISYSHEDMKWGEWLHRSLESYRVPRRLVGRSGRDGPIPKRLFPVFLDNAEFPAAGSLQEEMFDALRSARNLVVICSPNAAKSIYVNEEIIFYKKIGRQHRILSLIVDGEPNASKESGGEDLECFPKAARFKVLSDGRLSDRPAQPIAADVRPGKDSHREGLLRILAGIFGLSYDELKMRDRQRRIRRIAGAIAAAVIMIAMIGFALFWQELEKRKQIKAKLIESYTAIGQKELDASNPHRAAIYLGEGYRLGGDSVRLRLLLAHSIEALDIQGDVMKQTGEEVRAIKFSSSGQYMFSLSGMSRLNVWDMANGSHLASLDGSPARIEDVVFSPNHQNIIGCGLDRKVHIWDTQTGNLSESLSDHDSPLYKISIDPNGKFFATLGADGSAAIWDLNRLSYHVGLETDIAIRPPLVFDPSGTRLLTRGSTGNRLLIWEVATGQLIENRPVGKHTDLIHFIREGQYFVSIGEEGEFQIRDGITGSVENTFSAGNAQLIYAGAVDDGKSMVLVDVSGRIYIWDYSKQAQIFDFRTGMTNPSVVGFDGRRIVLSSPSSPSYHKVWDATTGTHLGKIMVFGEDMRVAAIAPGSDVVTTGSQNGVVRIWDLGKRKRHFSLNGHRMMVNFVTFNNDGSRLITGGSEASAKIWDCRSGRMVAELLEHESAIIQAVFSHDGTKLATVSADGAIGLWDGHSGQLIRFIQEFKAKSIAVSPGSVFAVAVSLGDSAILWRPDIMLSTILDKHRSEIEAMRFSIDGRFLATGNEDGTVEVWDATKGKMIRRLWAHSSSITSIDFDKNASRLLTTSEDSTAIVWSMEEMEPICTFDHHKDKIHIGRFSPDGHTVLTGGADNTAKLWGAATGRPLTSLDQHTGSVTEVAFGGNNAMVITGGTDRTVKIWETSSGELVRSLPPVGGEVLDIAVSPDGSLLAVAGLDPIARIWDLSLESRSREELSRLLQKRSKLMLAEGRLVAKKDLSKKDSIVGSVDREEDLNALDNQRSSDFDNSTASKTVATFINALESGNAQHIRSLISSDASSTLLKFRIQKSGDLKSFGEFFKDASIQNTLLRVDRAGALVLVKTAKGRIDIRLEEEFGEWKMVELRGRPHADDTIYTR